MLGIMITLAGSLAYVVMGILVKVIGKHLPLNQIMFLQSFSGLIFASCFIKFKKYKWQPLWQQHKPVYLARIAMSLGSIYALIYGLQYVSVFNALVILNLSPLIIPFLHKLFFKKKIKILILPFIALAFSGVILILMPDRHIIEAPVFIILISMLCMAFSLLLLEGAKNTDPNLSLLYYFIYSSLITAAILLWQQGFHIPLLYLPLGIVIGTLFFFVQFSVIYAAQYISSQLISILFYSEIILALFASVLLENTQLTFYLLMGVVFVIAGGIAVILIENKSQ